MTKRSVVLGKAAVRDIDTISDQTIERWGTAQARTYVSTIRADIESLGEFALRYPVHRTRRAELRKMPSGHHLVFYMVKDERIEVVRVLHERMDVEALLG